jgi:hypothetical protein
MSSGPELSAKFGIEAVGKAAQPVFAFFKAVAGAVGYGGESSIAMGQQTRLVARK